MALASASDSLNCAVSGASSDSGEGRKIKDALLARETVAQVDDFAGRVKAKRVEFGPHHAVLSRGKLERWRAAGWGGGRQSGERDVQAVRSGRVTVPSGASADRDSCVAGTLPTAQSATSKP